MNVLTVSDLTNHIELHLANSPVLSDVLVSGEISNLRTSKAEHKYFTIKDAQSQIPCVLFKGTFGDQHILNGSAVVLHGSVSFYGPHGTMQIKIDMVFHEGTGPIHLELEKLKLKLDKDGLFDPSRKRSLPTFPQAIGIATSMQGSVIKDMLDILERRWPLAKVIIAPTSVQGSTAHLDIVQSIERLNSIKNLDVIILARGGGSIEHLSPFNNELVARSIYSSHIPIVSAIGHETDFTISDQVADLRAATPSAAAEIIAPNKTDLLSSISGLTDRFAKITQRTIQECHNDLGVQSHRLKANKPDFERLRLNLGRMLKSAKLSIFSNLDVRYEQVNGLFQNLNLSNPLNILAKGYSIVEKSKPQGIVSDVQQLNPGENIRITASTGEYTAIVDTITDTQVKQ